jgi:hypothetical protein
MAQFGKVSVNPNCDWPNWKWKEFQDFYDSSMKGHCDETPEEVAKALGVVIPEKVKPDKVKPSGDA